MAHPLTLTIPAVAFAALSVAGCSAGPNSSVTATATRTRVTVAVGISGGYDTDPADNGRPVVLVASLLGVPSEVFRAAFTGVTPAAGDEAPQAEQVSLNKRALLDVLGPYGVTNEALDAASNTYRYSASRGESWARRAATATATITAGVVSSITITDGGRGYTSAPTITIALPDGSTATGSATVRYTADVATNGSITAITLGR